MMHLSWSCLATRPAELRDPTDTHERLEYFQVTTARACPGSLATGAQRSRGSTFGEGTVWELVRRLALCIYPAAIRLYYFYRSCGHWASYRWQHLGARPPDVRPGVELLPLSFTITTSSIEESMITQSTLSRDGERRRTTQAFQGLGTVTGFFVTVVRGSVDAAEVLLAVKAEGLAGFQTHFSRTDTKKMTQHVGGPCPVL